MILWVFHIFAYLFVFLHKGYRAIQSGIEPTVKPNDHEFPDHPAFNHPCAET